MTTPPTAAAATTQQQAPRRWYAIKAATAVAAAAVVAGAQAAAPEILLYGDIGESWWAEDPITARAFREDLAAIQASDITVRILSVGGSVPDGLGIYNALKGHPARITTINDGLAASIASLIFMAGDVRIAASNSLTMVHAPWTGAYGNAAQLRAVATELDAWTEAMAASYAEASGQPRADIVALLSDGLDHYYTAEEAVAQGFATQVGEATTGAQASVQGLAILARFNPAQAAASAAAMPLLAAIHAGRPAAAQPTVFPPAPQGAQPKEPVNMTKPTNEPQTSAAASLTPATGPSTAEVQAAARLEGARAEAARREAIMASCKPFLSAPGVAEVQAAALADTNITAAQVDSRVLAALGAGATPANAGRVVTLEDERDKTRGAAVQAILARAGAHVLGADGKAQRARAEGANPFRGMTLEALARDTLVRAGVRIDGMDRSQIIQAAFTQSTSDFPVLLENAMHKALQAGYAVAPDTHTRFCSRGTVSDFRAHSRYRTGSLGNLLSLTELAEFQNRTIPDGEKSSITAGTKGYLINISRQTIINDDLSAFVGLSNSMGRAAKRTVEADVYATLALNAGLGPVLSDGKTLFHADHGNLAGTGAVPSVVTIEAGRVAMASQMDVGANDFLDLRPSIALCGLANGSGMRLLNQNQYDPDASNKFQKANIVAGMFRDVVDTPRITGAAWMMFADPAEAPVIEVAYLDGNDMPFLDNQQGWNVDGSSWKVRLDYGIAGIDYRGAYRNPGA